MHTITDFIPRYWRRLLPPLLLACATAQADTTVPASWQLSMDNDAMASNNGDEDYTGGVSLAYSSVSPAMGSASPPQISLDALIGFLGHATGLNDETTRQTHYAIEAGLAIFTPDNIKSPEPQHDDRPYASLLYFSSSRQTLSPGTRQAITQTLTLGALGLSLSGNLQNAIHGPTGTNKAHGWEHQISAGGEPTLRYSLSRQTRHWQQKSADGADYEVSSTLKGNLGYLTDLGWGISGRLGRIASPWWSHNPLLEDYTERGSAHTTRGASRSQFYIWGGLFLRARAYNALLQGQFRDSTVSYSRSELNPFIADIWLGVDYVFAGGLRLRYSWRGQTTEIKHGKGDRGMTWGALSIAGNF